jgi:hypothetical protein
MDWQNVRLARNRILAQTDWTQCADVQSSFTEQQKQDWAMFRQKLRDITKDFDNVENVIFPQPPSLNF